MLYRVHLVRGAFELTTLVVIGTDYIYSCTSNYHAIAIATTTSLVFILCDVFVNIALYKMEAVSIAPVFIG